MPTDRAPEPWHSFLAAIDQASPSVIEMHCIGGFAVTLHYDLVRPTGDIDVWHVIPAARADTFDLNTFAERYRTELRPFLAGPESRHDLTLMLWLEAIAEDRQS